MSRRFVLTLGLIFSLIGMVNMVEELRLANASPYTNVDVTTAHNMITNGSYPDLVVLDVRTKSEYDTGHIYGTGWIPVAELESRIDELEGHENHEIIVYCASGGRSATASGILDSYNFTKVYNMLGGITAWQSADYPVWISTVHNLNTTVNYDTIQAAIDAPQTLDGHTIFAEEGVYYEQINVNKLLSLVGEDRSTTIIDGNETGHVIVIYQNNVTVTGFTIEGSNQSRIYDVYAGIRLDHVTYCNVTGNFLTNNSGGMILAYSNHNTIKRNNIDSNWAAISLTWECDQNIITGNNLTRSEEIGLYLDMSQYNKISGNYIASNTDRGIYLRRANYNIISRNEVLNNSAYGISVEEDSHNNSIIGNNIIKNDCGIRILDSIDNRIYHNNFINNSQQICNSSDYINFWDNGCQGNYWSNYNGTDLDDDGIGDTQVPWEDVDYYPLMNLYWNPCDINHDLIVDMKDVGNAARAFGTEPGDERWNPHVDITGPVPLEPDNKVNMRDIGLVARNFGETYA